MFAEVFGLSGLEENGCQARMYLAKLTMLKKGEIIPREELFATHWPKNNVLAFNRSILG
jgi:hypothetical protein